MQNFEAVSNKYNVVRSCTDSLGLSSLVLFPVNIATFKDYLAESWTVLSSGQHSWPFLCWVSESADSLPVVTADNSVSYNLIRLYNLWQNTGPWLNVHNSMFNTEVHTCGEMQHEALQVYCTLFYLLFKMYNMYDEILFCYMLTCGIRLLVQVPKIQIFTHMYINTSTCT